jgi:hypothetical protein
MDIYNYKDMMASLNEVRLKFYENSKEAELLLEEVINLWIDTRKLIANVVEQGDEEINILKVLDTAFRRIISSFILVESGLIKEAGIISRNAIEFIMIAIDIAYSKESLRIWIESENDNIEEYGNWHFTAKKIHCRIKCDVGNIIYHEWERNMVILEDNGKGNGLYAEWKRLSNTNVHAHSKAQLSNLYDSQGKFYLFWHKESGEYLTHFNQLRNQIMIIISIMLFIPKYHDKLSETQDTEDIILGIVTRFLNIQERMKIEYNNVI